MSIEDLINKAQEQGYTVGVAIEGYEDFPTVYRVEGFGVSLQLTADDESTWAQFTNDKAHEYREKEMRAQDPKDDFEWPSEEVRVTAGLEAAASTGLMTQEEADKSLATWKEDNPDVVAEEVVP